MQIEKAYTKRYSKPHTKQKRNNGKRIPSHIALTNISQPQCVAVKPTSVSNNRARQENSSRTVRTQSRKLSTLKQRKYHNIRKQRETSDTRKAAVVKDIKDSALISDWQQFVVVILPAYTVPSNLGRNGENPRVTDEGGTKHNQLTTDITIV